jgi:hypothetical protein
MMYDDKEKPMSAEECLLDLMKENIPPEEVIRRFKEKGYSLEGEGKEEEYGEEKEEKEEEVEEEEKEEKDGEEGVMDLRRSPFWVMIWTQVQNHAWRNYFELLEKP